MSSTLPPNTAHGSTKWNCGLASSPVGFSSAAISIQPKILQRVWRTILRSTIPITPIHIGGRIRANPWCGPHRLAKRVVNNGMVEPGLAHGPNDLNGPFIRLDLISGPLHNWQRTYETDI